MFFIYFVVDIIYQLILCKKTNKIKIGKYCGRHLNYEKNNII